MIKMSSLAARKVQFLLQFIANFKGIRLNKQIYQRGIGNLHPSKWQERLFLERNIKDENGYLKFFSDVKALLIRWPALKIFEYEMGIHIENRDGFPSLLPFQNLLILKINNKAKYQKFNIKGIDVFLQNNPQIKVIEIRRIIHQIDLKKLIVEINKNRSLEVFKIVLKKQEEIISTYEGFFNHPKLEDINIKVSKYDQSTEKGDKEIFSNYINLVRTCPNMKIFNYKSRNGLNILEYISPLIHLVKSKPKIESFIWCSTNKNKTEIENNFHLFKYLSQFHNLKFVDIYIEGNCQRVLDILEGYPRLEEFPSILYFSQELHLSTINLDPIYNTKLSSIEFYSSAHSLPKKCVEFLNTHSHLRILDLEIKDEKFFKEGEMEGDLETHLNNNNLSCIRCSTLETRSISPNLLRILNKVGNIKEIQLLNLELNELAGDILFAFMGYTSTLESITFSLNTQNVSEDSYIGWRNILMKNRSLQEIELKILNSASSVLCQAIIQLPKLKTFILTLISEQNVHSEEYFLRELGARDNGITFLEIKFLDSLTLLNIEEIIEYIRSKSIPFALNFELLTSTPLGMNLLHSIIEEAKKSKYIYELSFNYS